MGDELFRVESQNGIITKKSGLSSEGIIKKRVFFSLRDALACVDEARGEKIFAKEIGLHGKRLFTVYTKAQFWSFYKDLKRNLRKYYEVVSGTFAINKQL